MAVQKIKVRLLRTDDPAFFHDSRKDARVIAKAVNMLIDKVNELIEDNSKLREELKSARSVSILDKSEKQPNQ